MEHKEILLELPWTVVDDCNGFGLDFGGSVCKVIYLHNDDWVEPGKRKQDSVTLRCVNISRTEFIDSLDYLKSRVCIRRETPDHKPSIFVTGVGGAQYAKEIRETFGVETTTITEIECVYAAFKFILKNTKRGQIVHPINQDVVKRRMEITKKEMEMMAEMMKDSTNMEPMNFEGGFKSPLETPFNAEEKYMDYKDIFPCFLVMIGSNGGIFYIKEDGTYSFAADLKRAGRNFLGLASLLTNSTSFAEIMEKAENGSMRPVHEYISDLSKNIDTSSENFYSGFAKYEEDADMGEVPGFFFGKTVFKKLDDFRSEDLARSLLYTAVDDMVQTTHTAARLFPKVKHVFWCGGFPNQKLTRDFITEIWLERDSQSMSMFKQTEFNDLHFLKHGSHLGALGAYLNQHLKFIKTPEPEATEAK